MNREEIPEKVFEAILILMDAEIRERVHYELAPCTRVQFLERYLAIDPSFKSVLSQEFREVLELLEK
jgi:hypothetical protein